MEINSTILKKRETMVERYLFLFRLKFLEAIIPSKPNSFFVRGEVRSFFPFSLISWDCRMESMALMRMARPAGIQAEISVITRLMKTVRMRPMGLITSFISTVEPIRKAKLFRRHQRVMPIPMQPDRIPRGIPARQSRKPSNRTLCRICFLVAPMDFRMPNCFVRSLTEMEKEL